MKNKAKFADSTEATEFITKLQTMINDNRLAEYVAATDCNFGTSADDFLWQAIEAIEALVMEINCVE